MVCVAVSICEPLSQAGSTSATPVTAASVRQGKVRGPGRRPVRCTTAARVTSTKRPLGDRTRTAKRMMKGRLLGSPASVRFPAVHLRARSWATPMRMPPR
jgi:hypothetical protein